MSTLMCDPLPAPGSKRNARVRIEPIPDDLHARLVKYAGRRRYSKINDCLWFLVDIALSVMEAGEPVTVIKVNESVPASRFRETGIGESL